MKNYIELFESLYSSLRNNDKIKILELIESKYDHKRSSPQFTLKYLKDKFGYELDENFSSYFPLEGSKLRYVFYGKSYAVSGEYSLRKIDSALIVNSPPLIYNSNMKLEEIKFLKTFRVIDDHPFSGDFKLAAYSVKRNQSKPRLEPKIFFYDRGDYFLMNIDGYGMYLDRLLEFAAITNWQYFFCNVNFQLPEVAHIKQSLINGVEFLKILYPENDYSTYIKMLHE